MPFRSILALAVIFPAALLSLPVDEAAARTLTSTKAGVRCSYSTAPYGVFVGFFLGYEESKFNFSDAIRQFTTQRCFASATECDNWLYTMQSKYSVGASQARCRYKG
ncbi:hypothetical protein [Oricola cellulosilytica]|uniref:Uncharacterized protein n=1 Tax=Oricola cellulosilytica TaxID=1429082 RepID=A0A4R0PCQ5_9HYPH|nr:hypothetical protein [Oricola cellulosilytica]TCD14079.1 hypothetical protein E0D97_08270 [Oricola cellulosilytica]